MTRNGRLVWQYLKPELPVIVASTMMAILLGAVSACIGPLISASVTILSAPRDQVQEFVRLFGPQLGGFTASVVGSPGLTTGQLLEQLPFVLISFAFFSALFGLLQWFFWERTGEIVARTLREDLTSAYLWLDPAQRRTEESRRQESELSSTVTNDVRLLREYLVHFYGGMPRESVKVVAYLAMLIMLSPKLTAIFALGILPATALAARIGRVLRKRAAKALADYSLLTEWLQQRLLGIETIKHYRTEQIEITKMNELTTGLFQKFLRAARVKARTGPALEALAITCMAVVLVIALRDIAAGKTTGAIQLSFFATLGLLSQSADRLGRYLNSNREGAAAVDRLRSLLDFLRGHERRDVAARAAKKSMPPRIEVKGATVRYPGAKDPALKDFSYTFLGGKIYCLAGPSGAGKSTVFNLLLGLVEPEQGSREIHFDGPSEDSLVCYVPQKVLLLPGTVAANVAYPSEAFDQARVTAALAKVGMTKAVSELPLGIHAVVGEGGSGVSGGQAQRILLARLWYHKKPFVLVDEGTSALDPEIERSIHALLRDLANDGAVVVTIAHRKSAAAAADHVLELANGRLSPAAL